jgi:hypothetical protein
MVAYLQPQFHMQGTRITIFMLYLQAWEHPKTVAAGAAAAPMWLIVFFFLGKFLTQSHHLVVTPPRLFGNYCSL